MDNLWAPWRLKYILDNTKHDSCFLCEKIAQECDEENFILERGNENFVIMNIFPYNNGHLMIVPYRHTGEFDDLRESELFESSLLQQKWVGILKKNIQPDGFNIGINIGVVSGAGVKDHVHTHIVPRWQGDTNFMPVVSDIKVIPQSLHELYEILLKNK